MNLLSSGYHSTSIIFESSSGSYSYCPGGPRDVVQDLTSSLIATCDSLLEQLWLDFVTECRPGAIRKKQSVETKIKELKTSLEGVANVAEWLCPTLATVLDGGRENVSDRLNPIPGFEYIMQDIVDARVAKCESVLLPLRRRISKASMGGFARQVLSLQESHWPLSSAATAKIVKDLEVTTALFRVRMLDESHIPPLKTAPHVSFMDPVVSKQEEKIGVMRWAFCMTPPSEDNVRKRLFDELLNAHTAKINATLSLKDAGDMVSLCQKVAQLMASNSVWSIHSRKWLAKAYSLRYEVSQHKPDIEAAIESQSYVLEHLPQSHPQRPSELLCMNVYRELAAPQLKPTRTESRIHDHS